MITEINICKMQHHVLLQCEIFYHIFYVSQLTVNAYNTTTITNNYFFFIVFLFYTVDI